MLITHDFSDDSFRINYIDLFCGIGGFRIAAEKIFTENGIESKCVFACDNDKHVRMAYYKNFKHYPNGDIKLINEYDVPDHDLLFAGFPCQPFSIIGNGKGFDDVRGTLFFDIARILKVKRPKYFVLENVKRLVTHNNGYTLNRILETLDYLGYNVEYKVLNALHYGLPQKRERVIFVGSLDKMSFNWPKFAGKMKPLSEILEQNIDSKHLASEEILTKRKNKHKSRWFPSIWHENKSGNVSSYPYCMALRAGASYNYLLVNGERRLTPREMLRLQGFPDTFEIVCSDTQTRKQAGNAVPVNIIERVLNEMIPMMNTSRISKMSQTLVNHY